LARVANADPIAYVVEFLAHDNASYVTGGAYFVDGRMSLSRTFAGN
jgi:NAD(P)-dependent dehydrogenase (short-subunit alcohol dehydrogenase family)